MQQEAGSELDDPGSGSEAGSGMSEVDYDIALWASIEEPDFDPPEYISIPWSEEEMQRESDMAAAELEEYGNPLGWHGEFKGGRQMYEEWLTMMRFARAGHSRYATVPDRNSPFGGIVDRDSYFPYAETHFGLHPHYDYGYFSKLGRGRVLWDLVRPAVWKEVKNIKAKSIALFWMKIRNERVFAPGGSEYQRIVDGWESRFRRSEQP